MKKLNNLFIVFLLAFAIFLALGTKNVYASESSHKVLYTTNTFNIHGEHMNFIINSISSSTDNLIIDGYLLNLDTVSINEITDFHLKITDAKDEKIIDDVFLKLQLEGVLAGQSGQRLILSSPLKDKKIEKKDFSNINYNFSYNYTKA
ncbi:MAG: hypothetical protein ACRCTZ_19440 [Sarcina sp.]